MKNQNPFHKPEIWGGIESTLNRVLNNYRDQLALLSHHNRSDNINHIAQLDLKAIRFPVL